jgi:hypothetical protein
MLVLVPLIGAVGDIVQTVRSSQGITLHGSVLPVLLLVASGVATVFLLMRRWMLHHGPVAADMPQGELELLFREDGLVRRQWMEEGLEMVEVSCAWSEFADAQWGTRVLTLVYTEGRRCEALPLRMIDVEQEGWLRRFLPRKIKPARVTQER